jgi:hypothetical protein
MSTQKGHPIRAAVRTLPSSTNRNDTLRFRANPASIAMLPQTNPGTRICCFHRRQVFAKHLAHRRVKPAQVPRRLLLL